VEKEKSEPRESPKREATKLPLKVSPSPLSEDLPEEEVSRESPPLSMMIPDKSSRASSKESSEMLSPTLSTPEEKPSLLWMLSMLLRDKAELSMVSVVDQASKIICLHNLFLFLNIVK
jgi:hypothetical protein